MWRLIGNVVALAAAFTTSEVRAAGRADSSISALHTATKVAQAGFDGDLAVRTFNALAEPNLGDADLTTATSAARETYLLCWEHQLIQRGDREPTDLTIEINIVPSNAADGETAAAGISEPLVIPLPPALWSGLGGLTGLGVMGIWRRVTRRSRW
jgi:hypothetical protein